MNKIFDMFPGYISTRILKKTILYFASGGFIAFAVLYTISWSFRQIAHNFVSGRAISIIRFGNDAKRVAISSSPQLAADYFAT